MYAFAEDQWFTEIYRSLYKFCYYSALMYKVVLILLDTDVMAVTAKKHVIIKQSFLEIIYDSTMLQD
jgi:hypothetical protein